MEGRTYDTGTKSETRPWCLVIALMENALFYVGGNQ